MSFTRDYSRVAILSVLVILVFSTFLPAMVYAAPQATSEKDWQYTDGNSWAWNYSPETQINKNNVQNLEVKWVFPIGTKASAPAVLPTANLGEGSTTPPIVKDGKVFITTKYLKTYAIDAKTGQQIWTHDYKVDYKTITEKLKISTSLVLSHLHGTRYWEGGDAILNTGIVCDIYAIDAKTGNEKFRVNDLCANVPGNIYSYKPSPSQQNNIGTYDTGHQFIYVLPGNMHGGHGSLYYGDARHVTMGISMDAPYNVLWRIYSYPPQDKPTKDWATQECSIGYFQTYPCTEVAAKNSAQLEWDWSMPNQAPSPYGGVTANWGQPVVDEETGILYTNTGNQGPYTNLTLTPGPRLYGSTIMAIDMNAGKRIWWLQPFPHDPYDYDCNWSGILADVPNLGKVYMKGCKEGILYVMDAATGKPKYTVDVVNEQVQWGQVSAAAAVEIGKGGLKHHKPDPFSTDLREWKFISDGKYCGLPCPIYPTFSNGLFGTDMTYDPQSNTLYHYATGSMDTLVGEFPYVEGKALDAFKSSTKSNATLVARDATTGKVKWTWFYGLSAQRAHMVVTSDLLFTGFNDGNMRFFDKNSGKLLYEEPLGAAISVGVTTGQDSDGKQKIFAIPGSSVVIALGLADKAATGLTTTVTSTSATTQTVVSTSATTVTSTSTLATTQTVTQSVTQTETTGLPSEVTYAAIGIAVIAVIAAAVLMMRKK